MQMQNIFVFTLTRSSPIPVTEQRSTYLNSNSSHYRQYLLILAKSETDYSPNAESSVPFNGSFNTPDA